MPEQIGTPAMNFSEYMNMQPHNTLATHAFSWNQNQFKDLVHFPQQNAQLKGISLTCGIIAHILTLYYYTRLPWIEHFIVSHL